MVDELMRESELFPDPARKGDQAFGFVTAFTGHAGQAILSFDSRHDHTVLTLDVDGDRQSDFSLVINGEVTADAGAWLL